MKERYTNFLIRCKEKSDLSFEELEGKTGISASTLCRYFKGESEPTLDRLELIVEAMGASVKDMYADIGKSEMEAAKEIDYKGTEALLNEFSAREQRIRENCEQRIAQHQQEANVLRSHHDKLVENLRDSYERMLTNQQTAHEKALAKHDETYERSVSYLKEQIKALSRSVVDAETRAAKAETRASEIDSRRHNVFWGMLGVVGLQLVIMIIMVVVDAPGIGLGW